MFSESGSSLHRYVLYIYIIIYVLREWLITSQVCVLYIYNNICSQRVAHHFTGMCVIYCMYVCMSVCMHVCMHIYVYICVCVYIYIYIYLYMYMYVCMYI